MDEFLSAAREFDEQARHPVNRVDLGAALLLEYFALPLLAFTSYTPLRDRSVINPAFDALNDVYRVAPPYIIDLIGTGRTDDLEQHFPQYHEALTLIGHGLDQRRRSIEITNLVSRMSAILIIIVYLMIPVALMRDVWDGRLISCGIVAGGWFLAVASVSLVCLTNHHWRPRARLRGTPC